MLRELIEADNDVTLTQLAQRLAERTEVRVSGSTVSRTLTKMGITRKNKSLKASEVYREAKQQQRRDYCKQMSVAKAGTA